MLFVIVFVHEMGHALGARLVRWRILRIELLPFGGVAQTDEHGNRPLMEECIVIFAGPVQHVFLWLAAKVLHEWSFLDVHDYHLFLFHNVTILLFNLLPIWPLDGGRLLRVFCSFAYPYKEAITKSLLFSTVLLVLFSVWAFVYHPSHLNLWTVLLFLAFTHYREWQQRYYLFMRFLMGRYYDTAKPPLKLAPINVRPEERLNDVLARFQRGVYHTVIVRNSRKCKVFEEKDLLHAFFEEEKVGRFIGDL